MKKKRKLSFRAAIPWILAALFLAFCMWSVLGSKPFQSCISTPPESGSDQNLKESIAAISVSVIDRYRLCAGEFVDANGESIIAGFTVILALSTIALWSATDKLWKAGEKQMLLIRESAGQQSTDMQASIKAAQDSVDVARSSAEKQLRAYLAIDEMKPILVSGKIPCVRVMFINAGQTPARKVRLNYIGQFEANPEATKIHFRPTREHRSFMNVGPNRQMGFTIYGDIVLTDSVLSDMARASIRMVIAGVITYEDVFGRTRRLTFKGYTNYTDHEHIGISSCKRGNRSS
jgi:hypothetical protein